MCISSVDKVVDTLLSFQVHAHLEHVHSPIVHFIKGFALFNLLNHIPIFFIDNGVPLWVNGSQTDSSSRHLQGTSVEQGSCVGGVRMPAYKVCMQQ